MEIQQTTTLHSDTIECKTNALFPPLLTAPSPPTLNGNWIIYNGTIVYIHDSICPIFANFRYDSDWRCCIGTLGNAVFLGQLSDDARVITWNNGNTWIRQEPSIPNDSLVAYVGLPETGAGKSSSHTEQQKPAATHTAGDTSNAANLPTNQHPTHSKPQQQSQDAHEGAPNKRKRDEKAPYQLDLTPEPTHEHQATSRIGNDGTSGSVYNNATGKPDDWTTPTDRPRGNTSPNSFRKG